MPLFAIFFLKVPQQERIKSKNKVSNPISLPYNQKIDEIIPYSLVSEEESEIRLFILQLGFALILLLTSSVFCIITYPIMVENSPQVIVVLPISYKMETSNPMGKFKHCYVLVKDKADKDSYNHSKILSFSLAWADLAAFHKSDKIS